MSTAVCFELGRRTVPACVSLLHKCPQSFSPLCAQVSRRYCQSRRPTVTCLITLHRYSTHIHSHVPLADSLSRIPPSHTFQNIPAKTLCFHLDGIHSEWLPTWPPTGENVYACVCVCVYWPCSVYRGHVSLCDFTDVGLSLLLAVA